MAETISKGYLIYRQDYELFDEIIAFINEYGNIFTLIALGTKKILSKNSRNLFYGCLSEFSFFASRDIDNKMGKLKKVVLLENKLNLSTRVPLILLNHIIYKNRIKGEDSFGTISRISFLLEKYDFNYDEVLIIDILITSCKLLGIEIMLENCSICFSKQIYSFSYDDFGFVCKKHFNQNYKVNSSSIKLIYYVYKKYYKQANQFDNVVKKSVIRMLVDFINLKAGFNLYNYLFK